MYLEALVTARACDQRRRRRHSRRTGNGDRGQRQAATGDDGRRALPDDLADDGAFLPLMQRKNQQYGCSRNDFRISRPVLICNDVCMYLVQRGGVVDEAEVPSVREDLG